MAARLIEYQSGLQQALAAPPMVEACRRRMLHAELLAVESSPVDTGWYAYDQEPPKRDAGDSGGFHVEAGVRGAPPRAYGRLWNATPHARFLEFGTRYMERQRILGRVADALALV